MDLRGKKVLVVGLARTGRECARFLAQRGANVLVSDLRGESELAPGNGQPRAACRLSIIWAAKKPLGSTASIASFQVPGVPLENPLLQEAAARRIPVLSEIELAFRVFFARRWWRSPAPTARARRRR